LAAHIVSGGRFRVVEISLLSTAGRAAHAGTAPMHICHWEIKCYRLGVQVGFKLMSGKEVKEEGDGGPVCKLNLKA
jgi:hypothetical protein